MKPGDRFMPLGTLSSAHLLSYEMAWTKSTGARELSEHNITLAFWIAA